VTDTWPQQDAADVCALCGRVLADLQQFIDHLRVMHPDDYEPPEVSPVSECRNPACSTKDAPLSWADPDFCCDACRRTATPEPGPLTDPPLHAELAVTLPFVEAEPSAAWAWVHPWEPGAAGQPSAAGVPAALHQWLGARWAEGEMASGVGAPVRPAPVAVEAISAPPGCPAVPEGLSGLLGGVSMAEVEAGVETLRAALHREPTIIGGSPVYNVHDPARCEGRPCVLHHPSDHHMRDWPKRWRDDRRMVERTCPHGVGHPDPDDLAYRLTLPGPVGEADSGVHGCDGCCAAEPAFEVRSLCFCHPIPGGPHSVICPEAPRPPRRSWWARLRRRSA